MSTGVTARRGHFLLDGRGADTSRSSLRMISLRVRPVPTCRDVLPGASVEKRGRVVGTRSSFLPTHTPRSRGYVGSTRAGDTSSLCLDLLELVRRDVEPLRREFFESRAKYYRRWFAPRPAPRFAVCDVSRFHDFAAASPPPPAFSCRLRSIPYPRLATAARWVFRRRQRGSDAALGGWR